MKISSAIYDGSFGFDVAQALRTRSHDVHLATCEQGVLTRMMHISEPTVSASSVIAVACRGPALWQLVRIGDQLRPRQWIAAVPFERHIIITPVFGLGRVCAECFVRRWISQPPPGYYQEVVSAIASRIPEVDDFEYRNINPLAGVLAASALRESAEYGARYAICLDQAGISVRSGIVRALHGCRCREKTARKCSSRFVDFDSGLYDVLRLAAAQNAEVTSGELK